MRRTIAERIAFYSVDSPSGCRLWTGAKDGWGYARLFCKGRKYPVSRLIMEMSLGRALATREFVCHRCDTPACIREAHLFIGSHDDNMRDMVAKGRSSVRRGENHPSSVLTEDQVIAALSDPRPVRLIAADYEVSAAAIYEVRRGRNWRTDRVDAARRKLASNPAHNVTQPLESVSVVHALKHEAPDVRQAENTHPHSGEVIRERGN